MNFHEQILKILLADEESQTLMVYNQITISVLSMYEYLVNC